MAGRQDPTLAQLLKTRRFLPLFVTQFLGAFNDNLFKNAMVILITFKLAEVHGLNAQMMVTLAAGIFILPFFLFSATAGQLADKYEKALLIRRIKLAEVMLMLLGGVAFAMEQPWLLMAVLFLMGAQSSFFGPLKYGILPDHLRMHELVGGNALVETGTFIAILLGTILGGLLIMAEHGIVMVTAMVLGMAVLGWGASLAIPPAGPAAPRLRIDWNFLRESWRIVAHAMQGREVRLAILGISWFWLVGATFLSQFPVFAKDFFGGNEEVVTLFLTLFSVGIGIGSVWCHRLLRGHIHAAYVPLAAVGMTLAMLDLAHVASPAAMPDELMGAWAFLQQPQHWRAMADLWLVAVFGGVYIVPLYAIMQSRAQAGHVSRTVAANNIMNALFMVFSALTVLGMLALGLHVVEVFITLGVANGLMVLVMFRLVPQTALRGMLRMIFRLFYRVEFTGKEHWRGLDGGAVLVANHVSFLDAALIVASTDHVLTFAIDTHMAQRWWVRPLLRLVDGFPVDPTNPLATKALIHAVRQGKKVVIFPEGRITVTGSLMKVYDGPGMIADKSGAPIVPIHIEGAQYSYFSRLKGVYRRRLFPAIRVSVLAPRRFSLPEALRGRARRQAASRMLQDVMAESYLATSPMEQTLMQGLLAALRVHGARHVALEDVERKPVALGRLLVGSLALGRHMARYSKPGEAVGLMLPNSVALALAFFGLQAMGRVPAMLNFTSGSANLRSACKTAVIGRVYSSRRFVQLAKLEPAVEALRGDGVTVVFLEDVKGRIGMAQRVAALAGAWRLFGLRGQDAGRPAVILFTSGSEGAPKAVVLSHRNLMANRYQMGARVDFGPKDRVFNALPLFHSFGLTGGLILPLMAGVAVFLYPSPLHYRIVPVLVYDSDATIFFGTDTFLAGYARHAHPYDFYRVRYVFAGAEKLKDETRELWMDKFGLRVLEGYGTTEAAPVVAANTPMRYRRGTVGALMPGMEMRLEPMEGIEEGGRLHIKGPNIMMGYMLREKPGEIQPPRGGWYDTGDIVAVDEDGFIRICGRAKRFAKIGGEMVSLAAVEGYIAQCWPDAKHAVVALEDARKGEQLVLATTQPEATREALARYAREHGISELAVPRRVEVMKALPVLGTGKVDYVALKAQMAEAA